MNIRPLEKKDTPEVAQLIHATWYTHADIESGFLRKEYLESIDIDYYLRLCFGSDTNFMFVAEENGKIIGCCRVEIQEAEPVLVSDRLAYIHDIIVDEDFQRHHVATALLETIETFVKKDLKIHLIKSRVYTFNTAATGLFEKRHYKDLYSEFYKKLD
ncbi:MAG: GNAT family N-acetyltransferase [Candidatus Taylorbacteria bacterium]|nr:GNAT family N-acetyltransferase [Candidatus Taylorbacteria bacterium]